MSADHVRVSYDRSMIDGNAPIFPQKEKIASMEEASLLLTIKSDGNFLWRHNLHGNRLLVRIQVELLYPRPTSPLYPPIGLIVAIAIVTIARFVC